MINEAVLQIVKSNQPVQRKAVALKNLAKQAIEELSQGVLKEEYDRFSTELKTSIGLLTEEVKRVEQMMEADEVLLQQQETLIAACNALSKKMAQLHDLEAKSNILFKYRDIDQELAAYRQAKQA